MAVLEMLTEVIRAEKLLRLVAFAEFVLLTRVLASLRPVRWTVGEFGAAETAHVCRAVGCCRGVEDGFDA